MAEVIDLNSRAIESADILNCHLVFKLRAMVEGLLDALDELDGTSEEWGTNFCHLSAAKDLIFSVAKRIEEENGL